MEAVQREGKKKREVGKREQTNRALGHQLDARQWLGNLMHMGN